VKLITEQIGLKTDWANRKMSVCMLQSVVQPIASCTQYVSIWTTNVSPIV